MPDKYTIGCIVGTRPELIKMAPIIFKLQASTWAKPYLINTAQHRELLDELMELFGLKADIDLNVMTNNQTLSDLSSTLIAKLDKVFAKKRLDAILAAGDTTTAFISALVAFYRNIPFGHIEAGMRTHQSRNPFPEEMNRVLIAPLTTWHFAPTIQEKKNLLQENINQNMIFITGNPGIDSLYWVLANTSDNLRFESMSNMVLITIHRRESFGPPLETICDIILKLSQQFKSLIFVWPVHPNPNVQQVLQAKLANKPGIYLTHPLRYDEFAHALKRCLFVITDSGGIQEEAPALNKPVLILRNTTERTALVSEGLGLLVGTHQQNICHHVKQLLENKDTYDHMSRGPSPYGDGNAAQRIVEQLKHELSRLNEL